MAKDRSLEGSAMKKLSLIAGIASLATLAAVWSLPAAAAQSCGTSACAHQAHNKWPGRAGVNQTNKSDDTDPNSTEDPASTSLPEPAPLALFALGFGGLGLYAI